MTAVFEFFFYLSVCMVFYVYVGYPLIIAFVGSILRRNVRKSDFEPEVTVIISAYNEEDNIAQTLENKLRQDYPKDKVEVIVVSDGSDDRTDSIVTKFADQGVRLFRQEPRAGKTAAINKAVSEANGEILVFSDANSLYSVDALHGIVQNFADPEVGYVTGKMIYTNPNGETIGDGCTAYMRYENFLRVVETKAGSIVGVDGGIDAVRKRLYRMMAPDQLPDFVLPLSVVELGFRVVYEPHALMKEPALQNTGDEYRMRVRVALRSFWALKDKRHMLSFKRLKLYAWQLWSHKVLRYLCFIFMIVAWISNLLLLPAGNLYRLAFALQSGAYIGVLLSPYLEKMGYKLRILYLFRYFVLLNVAAAHAFIKFLQGHKVVMWSPRKG
jgi:cellulose synthase/poly-beta-1,6-N-acetylglucosamine synthase-like glycosyltransferase